MEICFFHGNCHGKEANKIYFINIKYIFYNIYDERIYGTCMCVLYIDHLNIRVMILNKWYELHEAFLFYGLGTEFLLALVCSCIVFISLCSFITLKIVQNLSSFPYWKHGQHLNYSCISRPKHRSWHTLSKCLMNI